MKTFPDFSWQDGWTMTEYPEPHNWWQPVTQPGTGTGIYPQIQPYTPGTNPYQAQPNWIGDDPNGWKITGGSGSVILGTTGTSVQGTITVDTCNETQVNTLKDLLG